MAQLMTQFITQFGTQFVTQFGAQFITQFGTQFVTQFGAQFKTQLTLQYTHMNIEKELRDNIARYVNHAVYISVYSRIYDSAPEVETDVYFRVRLSVGDIVTSSLKGNTSTHIENYSYKK
jgi:hypothetical protein